MCHIVIFQRPSTSLGEGERLQLENKGDDLNEEEHSTDKYTVTVTVTVDSPSYRAMCT